VIEPEADCNTSKEALLSTFPNLNEDDAEVLANAINTHAADYGIDNKFKLRHFLSQIGHETDGLSSLNRSEDLNYTTSNRLLSIFPKYFSYTDQTKENPDVF
jgi:putative chitinase